MRAHNDEILASTAISSTTTYTSDAVELTHIAGYAISLLLTGTATGTAKLQAAMTQLTPASADWIDLPNSGATANIAVDAGAATKHLWNVSDAFYKWVRVSYTNATNSGTLAIRANLKGV
jgi:hypothetical protein